MKDSRRQESLWSKPLKNQRDLADLRETFLPHHTKWGQMFPGAASKEPKKSPKTNKVSFKQLPDLEFKATFQMSQQNKHVPLVPCQAIVKPEATGKICALCILFKYSSPR